MFSGLEKFHAPSAGGYGRRSSSPTAVSVPHKTAATVAPARSFADGLAFTGHGEAFAGLDAVDHVGQLGLGCARSDGSHAPVIQA